MTPTKSTIPRSVVIAKDGYISTVLDKSHYKRMAIIMPAAWTAADIYFLGCDTVDGTFALVYNVETDASPNLLRLKDPAANLIYGITGKTREALAAVPFIKLQSGSGQGTAQAGGIIKFILMRQ